MVSPLVGSSVFVEFFPHYQKVINVDLFRDELVVAWISECLVNE